MLNQIFVERQKSIKLSVHEKYNRISKIMTDFILSIFFKM